MDKSEKRSCIGWNWGTYTMDEDEFSFAVKGSQCFILPYSNINLVTSTNNNEVAIELGLDNVKDDDKGDYLSELRFFIPNNDANEKDSNKKDDEEKEQEDEEEEKGEIKEEEDDSKSLAQILADKLIK